MSSDDERIARLMKVLQPHLPRKLHDDVHDLLQTIIAETEE